MTEKEEPRENKRGRPRDVTRDKVILEAVLYLLAKSGYEGLTIEAVAKEAKVGKTPIYRRWSSKVELVIEAASSISPYKTMIDHIDCSQSLRTQFIEMLSISFEDKDKFYQQVRVAIGIAMPHHKELEKVILTAKVISFLELVMVFL